MPIQKGFYVLPGTDVEIAETTDPERRRYMAMVGALNYIATHTRPDISVYVNQLSKYMHNPVTRHLKICEDVFLYLKKTKALALQYPRAFRKGALTLLGWSDANFPDTPDAKATTGMIYCIRVGNRLAVVSYCSHKQNHVCDSTQETELSAASEAAKEGIALKGMLVELGLLNAQEHVTLFIDNRATVTVAKDGGYYPRLKHINRKHKFLVQAVQEERIEVQWCAGSEMLADSLSKPVGAPQLQSFVKQVFNRQ